MRAVKGVARLAGCQRTDRVAGKIFPYSAGASAEERRGPVFIILNNLKEIYWFFAEFPRRKRPWAEISQRYGTEMA